MALTGVWADEKALTELWDAEAIDTAESGVLFWFGW
jgi:hypothetical protein